ncbi:MAG TPA: ABC transporter permease [Longimicrobiales bacterium]
MRHTLEVWMKDFLHGARGLLRAPGFTLVTVATLALAIGANTAIFSVVDAVLIDPLPFPDADRLVSIRGSAPGSDLPAEFGLADEVFVQYRDNATMLEGLGAIRGGQTTVRAEEQADRLFVALASASLFSTLRVTPILGRLPAPDDGEDVAVISHWLWTSWFGGDPSVVGRSIEVSGRLVTVIGVMGPEFTFPNDRLALWIHGQFEEEEMALTDGGAGALNLVGRLAPGATREGLAAQLAILVRRVPERFGGSAEYQRLIERHRPIVRSLADELVGDVAGPLLLLFGTVGIVLLIACANVANLFVARSESRRQDLAVRQALGAGRASLIRSQMAEALLLAALGGAIGALLAWAAVPLLVRAAPDGIPNLAKAGLDPGSLLFTAGLSILAACAFGLLPAIRFSHPRLAGGLRQVGGIGTATGSLGRHALVVVQTASALVLLVGAGLLVRSFVELTRVDPGYDTEDIFTFQIAPERAELNDGPTYARFHQTFLDRLSRLSGVESVGLSLLLPLDEGAAAERFASERTEAAGGVPPLLRFTAIGGDYFATMGISLLRGRAFGRDDHVVGRNNAIVSAAAAELLWPGEDPLGRRLRFASDTIHWFTVVGVVEDILLEDFRQTAVDPMVYLPMVGPEPRSWAVGSPAYVVKSARAKSLAPEIRELVRELAPESPMYRIFTMEGLAARSMARLSFTMIMLAVAAGLALVLGAVGLYGVLSYIVTQRTREIAVRMALGAQAPQVRRMIVLQGGRVTLAGIAIGLVLALAVTRLLASLLYGVGPMDATTFAAMSAVMLATAVLASYVPARRASAVDPMTSLRAQ